MTLQPRATRILVSSTAVDLRQHRQVLLDALTHLDATVVGIDAFGASNQDAITASRSEVATADMVIVLVAWRYGYIPPGANRSITQLEYEEARRLGKPTFVFLAAPSTEDDTSDSALFPAAVRDPEHRPQLLAFRQQLMQTTTVAYFTTPDSLARTAAEVIYRATLEIGVIRPSQPRDNKIFISYRRLHVPYAAGRIYDWLERRFGADAIFFDVMNMPPAKDFRKHVRQVIGQCAVELVVITPQWIDARDGRRRRLHQAEDTVRIEVETALEYDINVVPLFVAGAAPPREKQLPATLRPLSRRSGLPIRDGRDFHTDIEQLIDFLEPLVGADV